VLTKNSDNWLQHTKKNMPPRSTKRGSRTLPKALQQRLEIKKELDDIVEDVTLFNDSTKNVILTQDSTPLAHEIITGDHIILSSDRINDDTFNTVSENMKLSTLMEDNGGVYNDENDENIKLSSTLMTEDPGKYNNENDENIKKKDHISLIGDDLSLKKYNEDEIIPLKKTTESCTNDDERANKIFSPIQNILTSANQKKKKSGKKLPQSKLQHKDSYVPQKYDTQHNGIQDELLGSCNTLTVNEDMKESNNDIPKKKMSHQQKK